MSKEEDGAVLKKFAKAVKVFEDINPNMNAAAGLTFLAVAEHEGCTLTELANITGYPLSSISRRVLDLGPKKRHGSDGDQLIDMRVSPTSMREKQLYLTPKGRSLLKRVVNALK